MNNFFQKLKQESLNIKLSHDEKQVLRASLYDAMRQPVQSPYAFISLFHARILVPLSIVLVVLIGSGTAYAAQGALPGDPLYPVKINVNEAVEVALATTPAQKATAEVRIAERRVAEAQTLAAQGRLDATTTQEIEDNFNSHASRALALTGESVVATTSASTSAESVGAQLQGGEDGRHALPAMTSLTPASTTPEIQLEATSSEAQAPDSSLQTAEDNIPASLQIQKNILNELKQRVSNHRDGEGND